MAQSVKQPQRIQQLIEARPILVAGKLVQPVARLDGWWQTFGATGEGGLVRIVPATIHVREGERSYSLPMTDPLPPALRTLFYVGGIVSLVCIAIMVSITLFTPRR